MALPFNIKQPITAGTTAALTLGAAATNDQAISAGRPIGHTFPGRITDDNGAWEESFMVLTATNTLSRLALRGSSTGSLLDASALTNPVVSEGPSLIGGPFSYPAICAKEGKYVYPGHVHDNGNSTSITLTDGEIMYLPYPLLYSGTFDALCYHLSGTVDCTITAAVHAVNEIGEPGAVLATTAANGTTSTNGQNVALVANVDLPAGAYFVSLLMKGDNLGAGTGTADIQGYAIADFGATWLGGNDGAGASPLDPVSRLIETGATAIPDPPLTGNLSVVMHTTSGGHPAVILRAA